MVAVVPVVVLAALRSWSASQDDGNPPAPPIDPVAVVPTPTPQLSTGVTSFRRLPTIISRELNIDAFAGEVSPFLVSVNDRSCAAISLDGAADRRAQRRHRRDPGEQSEDPGRRGRARTARRGLPLHHHRGRVAEPLDGVVDGDLFLVGGGDPLLSSDWYPASNLELNPVTSPTSLDALADRVVAAGVTEITGSVVGDGSRYDDEYFAPGWGDGVAGLEGGPVRRADGQRLAGAR